MDPREVIARIALESGDRRETLTQLRAIVQGHAGGEDEGLHHAARLLAQAAAGDALLTAETLFERVAAQDPSPADLRLNFSRVLLDAGQRAAASVQLLKALEAQPDFADAQYALGVLALNARDYDAAESWLRKSLGSGRPQESAFQLGRLAEKRGDHDKALDWYQRVTHGGQAIDALVRRCHVLGKLGRVDDARTLLQNLRQQLPQMSTRFYVVEATLLSDLKQPEAALEVYNAALREFPDDSDLLYSRSLLHETQKRIDLAEADLRTMLRRDPDDARAMNALGYMLTVHTRRYKEAHELGALQARRRCRRARTAAAGAVA
jgi:tetratricopeptide (TPR) repeat protein